MIYHRKELISHIQKVCAIELKSELNNSGRYSPIGDIIGQLNRMYVLKRK